MSATDLMPLAPRVNRVREPMRVLGTTVTHTAALKRAAVEDLGIDLEFISLDGTEAQRWGALHSDRFDVYDQWFHDIDLIWPTGSLQPIDAKRINRWSEIEALPRIRNRDSGAPMASGSEPSERLFVQMDGTLGDAATEWVSMLPTVHNADSFGVVGAEPGSVRNWDALLDPAWAGNVSLQTDAAIGVLDMTLALHARGDMRPKDAGDLGLEEIDALVGQVEAYRRNGHFGCLWADESDAVRAFARNERFIGSLWWPGFIKLRALGVPVELVTPTYGYRGWFGGLSLSARAAAYHLDAAYDYFNWWYAGRAGALMSRSGAYMMAQDTLRSYLTEAEWDFWYDGKPAATEIRDADGMVVFRAGERREGGSYAERMARVAIWDTVMCEHNYLVRRWEHALTR
ncbi:ABC transporter, binding protein [Oceanicola granulosus HTCC2516]|uniref:ABC transporter, binding protein n=1 Tax=Oceanicola granulosus (strain ATCC BAA-861 / DSM 15982 / KCTC 12143 / HTCC2516) TaxID=314256 RepID=Q2CGK6_OCEGH|nr:extracellular solute-binding protein [Oceanicola granulosus]EAR51712.1 ABC transporter, binding protein [Oceanicola granulosus HTCC2516]